MPFWEIIFFPNFLADTLPFLLVRRLSLVAYYFQFSGDSRKLQWFRSMFLLELSCVLSLVLSFLSLVLLFVLLGIIHPPGKFTRPLIISLFSRKLEKDKRNTQLVTFPQVTYSWIPFPLILNGWYVVSKIGTVGMKVFTEYAAQHGKTFYLPFGPLNVLATADVDIIKALLSSNSAHHLSKSGYIYKRLFVEELHNGLFVSNPNVWFSHRKCLSKAFTYNRILSSLSVLNKHTRNLVKDIDTLANKPLENGEMFAKCLSTYLLRFTAHLITGPGSATDSNISQIQESIETHKTCLLHVFRHPHLFLRPLWRRSAMKEVSDQATRNMYGAMRQMMYNYSDQKFDGQDDKFQEDGKYEPMMELMINNKWSEKEILDNFGTLIFAENEATFAGIQFSLLHLALNREHQVACQNEIDALFISKGTPLEYQIEDLSQLKHLERCILESLRLLPPVPVFARRLGAPLKVKTNREISAGTTVMIMPWVLHRNPQSYPNPDTFNPDNFLPENVRKRENFAYLPFSAGRRNCLGWKLSLIQLKLVVASILRNFEISTPDKLENIRLFYAVRVIPERNFHLSFSRRVK